MLSESSEQVLFLLAKQCERVRPHARRARVTLFGMSLRKNVDWKAIGRYGRRVKGALHAHATIRARGGVPGEEARAARKRNAADRHSVKEVEVRKAAGENVRIGHTLASTKYNW